MLDAATFGVAAMSVEDREDKAMPFWPNTERQAKIAIVLLSVLMGTTVGLMAWFGVARRILAE